MSRIPVTIITGFLGSGKTTLLNKILDKNPKRIAVIENEFAAAFGVENEILHQDNIADIQNLYEFGMGCVCCSSSGELINALVEIAIRNQHEPTDRRIQHVILETTGLADPAPILQLITKGADRKGTDDIVQNYYLDGIITLLDSKHFDTTLDSLASIETNCSKKTTFKNELFAQILTTDLVILNKMDLLPQPYEAHIEKIKHFIHQHNPTAKIITTSFAEIKGDINTELFGLRPVNMQDMLNEKANEQAEKGHDPSIEQTMLLAHGCVDLDAVKQFIAQTTADMPDIYRIKGVLALKSDPTTKYVVQGVAQDQLFVTSHGSWKPDEVAESRLTLIGRNVLSRCVELEKKFKDACLA